MDRSETIAELAKALAKAQAEMPGAKKGAINPHFRSRYADLESTWEACRGPLSRHGLSVVQVPYRNGGDVGVETLLLHESGEWISGRLVMTMADPTNPQCAGSIITYLRRYSLQGMVGIAPEDDDANAAVPAPEAKPAVELDPEVLRAMREATSIAELAKVWEAIPVGMRRHYSAHKDAAKLRLQDGTEQ